MYQRGNIEESDYLEMLASIKDNMDRWQADCEAYNDPNTPNPFGPFFQTN